MKTLLLAMVAILFAGSVFAQSIDDGKKFLYYERYKSAKDIFQKLSTGNPADETAAYYLGQAMIGLEDVAGAKALYQQKLLATPNSPLILAGMGHVELLEGKTADARNRFETAISLSAGKRIDVLNAIGAPNSDPEIKNGDANYAIDKLKMATTIKGFKDPEVWANLGDAYRKNSDGGAAIQSYDAALRLDPNYARAIYRKGRLYQSQGRMQENLYSGFYNDAIAKDVKYAPVYNTLFNYYYETDVPKSAQYLEKWLSNSDNDPKACFYRANILYAQAKYAEAIKKADECVAADGANIYPKIYQVKAFSLFKLGDSSNSKTNFEQYFKTQNSDKIFGGDYAAYAAVLNKSPGNEKLVVEYYGKAVMLDSVPANKISYLKELANTYRNQKNFGESAKWFNQVISLKTNYSNVDLYNAGYDYFRAGMFDSSVAVFNKYTSKYPDDIFGYYMIAKANGGIDTTLTTGLALNSYLKAIEIGEKVADKSKVKDQLVGAYTFMMQYSYNIKRDQAAAIAYADKALALDPTDTQSIKNKDFVSKNDPGPKPSASKPKSSSPKKK